MKSRWNVGAFAELKSPTCKINDSDTTWEIPFSSNSVEVNGKPSTIFDTGLHNWMGSEKIRMYFHVNKSCELKFALKCKVPDGNSKVEVRVLGVPNVCPLSGSEYHEAPVGTWSFFSPGVVRVDLEGVEKTDDYFADVTHLIVAHESMDEDEISFLDDSDENFLYWNKVRPFQKFDSEIIVDLAEVPRAKFISATAEIEKDSACDIPFSSNSVMLSDTSCILFDSGIRSWTSNQSVRMYFYVKESCEVNLALKCKVPDGSSKVEVKLQGLSKVFQLTGSDYHNVSIGKWKVSGRGCVHMDLKGIENTGGYVADVTHLVVSTGLTEKNKVTFLSGNNESVLYWMRMTDFNKTKSKPSGLEIPFSSNSIIVTRDNPTLFHRNIYNWRNDIICMYFYIKEPCELDISLKYKVAEGNSRIEVKILDVSREITLSGPGFHTTSIGKWNIPTSGCVTIDFKGIEKTGNYFAEITHLIVSQDTMQGDSISFLDESDECIRYWQRRTPPKCDSSVFEINNKLTQNIHATFISPDFDMDEHSAFWQIPFSSNSHDLVNNCIFDSGIHNWTSYNAHIRMYFYVKSACTLNIALKCKVPEGISKIRVRVLGVTNEYQLSGSKYHTAPLGKWQVSSAGWVTVDMEGIERSYSCFADVTHLVVSKEYLEEDAISFLEDSDQNILYWKRMGLYKDNVGDIYNSVDLFGKDAMIWEIPFSSNSIEVNRDPSTVDDTGMHDWLGSEQIRMHFYINESCEYSFALKYKVSEGTSKIEINLPGNRVIVTLTGSEYHITRIGKWTIPITGWATVDLKGVEKSGDHYADVTHLIVSSTETGNESICFLGDSSDDFLYWQIRGPPRSLQDDDIEINSNFTANSINAIFVSPISEFNHDSVVWRIPFSCNSVQLDEGKPIVLDSGIRNWNSDQKIRMFFYVNSACELNIALNCKLPTGNSKIIVEVLGVPKVFLLSESEYKDVPLGKWKITNAGYVTVDLEGFQKTDGFFADVNHLVVLKGNLASDAISFLSESNRNFLYWQKIGPPQLHMKAVKSKTTNESAEVWEIPFSSNSVELNGNNSTIFDTGIHAWCENEEIRLYFYVKEPCELSFALKCKVPYGSSKIRVKVSGTSRTFLLSGSKYSVTSIGTWNIEKALVTVDLKGIERTGNFYADVTHLIIKKGGLDEGAISFLDDSEENLRYWKCRGSPLKEQNVGSGDDVLSRINAELLNVNSKVDNYHTLWVVPFTSNAVELNGHTDSIIPKSGIHSWDSAKVIRTHFYVNGPCELDMTLWCYVPNGTSKVKVKVLEVPQTFTFSGTDTHTEPIGKWKISGAGCVTVDLEGIEKTGNYFADVNYLTLSSSNLDVDAISYLENTDLNALYWKCRGPPKIILPNENNPSQDVNSFTAKQ